MANGVNAGSGTSGTSGMSGTSGSVGALGTGMPSLSAQITDFTTLTSVVRNVFRKEIKAVIWRGLVWVLLTLTCLVALIYYYNNNIGLTEQTLPFFLKWVKYHIFSNKFAQLNFKSIFLAVSDEKQ